MQFLDMKSWKPLSQFLESLSYLIIAFRPGNLCFSPIHQKLTLNDIFGSSQICHLWTTVISSQIIAGKSKKNIDRAKFLNKLFYVSYVPLVSSMEAGTILTQELPISGIQSNPSGHLGFGSIQRVSWISIHWTVVHL